MEIVLGIIFVLAIAMAGSEGDWFPVVNYMSIPLFVVFIVLCNKYLKDTDDNELYLNH